MPVPNDALDLVTNHEENTLFKPAMKAESPKYKSVASDPIEEWVAPIHKIYKGMGFTIVPLAEIENIPYVAVKTSSFGIFRKRNDFLMRILKKYRLNNDFIKDVSDPSYGLDYILYKYQICFNHIYNICYNDLQIPCPITKSSRNKQHVDENTIGGIQTNKAKEMATSDDNFEYEVILARIERLEEIVDQLKTYRK